MNSKDQSSYSKINGCVSVCVWVCKSFCAGVSHLSFQWGALDLAQWERTLHLPSSPPPAERERHTHGEKKAKKEKLHYFNIIIPLGIRLITSKLAVLHSSRQRHGNTRGRHNEAVMCTKTFLINTSANVPDLTLTCYGINHIRPQRTFAQLHF